MQAARQSRLRLFCRVPSHDRCSDKYCHDTQRCQAYDGWRVPAEFGVNSRNNDGLGFDCCPLLFRAHAGRPGGVWSRGLCWAVVWHRPALSGACVLAGTRRSRTRRHYQGLRAMLTYNFLAAAYLGYLRLGRDLTGVLLWPAVIVHTLFAIGFALAVWKPRAVSL